MSEIRELTGITRQALALLNPDWDRTRELRLRFECVIAELAEERTASVVKVKAVPRRRVKKGGVDTSAIAGSVWEVGRGILWRLQQEGLCTTCKHPQDEHRASDKACVARNGEYRANGKYHATRAMSFNIAVRAAELIAQGKLERQAPSAEGLEFCACGHGSQAHTKDALENLLKCGAPGCACDHFHYAHKDAA